MIKISATHTLKHNDYEIPVCYIDDVPSVPLEGIVDRVQQLQELTLRDEDVLVVSYPRSGTHWTCNLANLILHKEDFKRDKNSDKFDYFFFEKDNQEVFADKQGPRVFCTHLLPKQLPNTKNAKIIHIARNPKDSLVSMYEANKRLPIISDLTFNAMVEMILAGKFYHGDWFEFIKIYENFVETNKEQCCSLVYEDLIRNPYINIQRLAEFLGVTVTNEEIEMFLEISSISNRKRYHEERKDRINGLFYNKGVIGNWKNYFTIAQNATFDIEYEKRSKIFKKVFEFE